MMLYDAIIFLNNAGAALLEYEQYQESLMTFRDAMYAKRFLYSHNNTSDTAGMQTHDFEKVIIPTILSDATKRICSIQKKAIASSTVPLEERLVTLNFMDDDCFVKLLAYNSCLDQIDIVFPIDHETDEEYKCDRHNWELNSAILLYNFALACKRAVYSHPTSGENHCQLLEESMAFFQYAYDIVMVELEIFSVKIIERSGHTKDELESILRIITVAMFIAIQLSSLSYHITMSNEGDEYHDKYERLSLLFSNVIKDYISHPVTLTKHAASA